MALRAWHLVAAPLVMGLMAAPALARNTEHLLSIRAVLATPKAQSVIGSDITLRFGTMLPDGWIVVGDGLRGRGNIDPRMLTARPNLSMSDVQISRMPAADMSDEDACAEAFVAAMADLVRQARVLGAKGVLGVVSNYDQKERDSTDYFECHAGSTRVIVDLKGYAAKPGQAGVPSVQTSQAVSRLHRSAVPPATGFADASNIEAVPLSDAGKDRYRHYLTLSAPKAFVIFETGAWRFYHADPDAMSKALDYCKLEGKVCWLYAVDHQVVWHKIPAKRIANSMQLGNE